MDYWLALLPPREEESVEEHLLACGECGGRLREIKSIADGIRQMARVGEVHVIISEEFLQRAAKEGLRVREYSPPSGGTVNCTVTRDDDMLVAKLAADLRRAERVDLVYTHPGGTRRFADVPVNPESGKVILNVAIDAMRAAPAHVAVVKLVSVEDSGERVLGEYTFNHTPSPG